MKNLFKSLMLFAAAGIALTGCVKEDTITTEATTTGRIIKANAWTPETRVTVESSDESSVSLNWAEGDALDLHGFAGTTYKSSVEASDYIYNDKNLGFSFKEISGADTYYASHPAEAITVSSQYNEFIVNIPAEQKPTQEFVDPSAVMLLSDAVKYSGEDDANFTLSHAAAYAKMLVKSNEPIQSVTVTSLATTNSNNKYGIAGQYWIYYAGDKVGANEPGSNSVVSTSINITAPANGFAKEGDYYAVWFTLIPQELTSFSVNVKTASGELTKKIPVEGNPLTFTEGKAKSFKVDMTNIAEASTIYNLITDVEDFTDDGEYILTAKIGEEYYYMTNTVSNNKFTSAKISVSDNKIATDETDCVWAASFSDKNFTLKNIEKEQYIGYGGSSTNISLTNNLDDKAKWTITYEGGEFKIVNVSSTNRAILYNGSLFGGYSTGNYQKEDNNIYYSGLTIFKKEKPEVPKIIVEQETLNISADGDSNTMTVTVTDYTSDVTVDISYDNGSGWVSEANWNDNILTYSVDKNENADSRTAYITIKASNEVGEASKTITVNQKGSATQEYVDVLNYAFTGISGTNYDTWNDKKGSSSNAIYAGRSGGQYESIQLNSTSPSGVVTTTSGGKATKITIKWNSNTNSARSIDVYGKHTAYSSGADLYNSNSDTQGTKLGSLTNTSTELVIEGTYEYIGFRSNNSALYIDEVQITWED